ncbi:polyketide synthase PksN [Lachnotalea glycerini]|uniref:Polyketide synthase PksN n=1 Tax=Lachnotalea glycerini TaxID=1763509 RepID=A0A318ESG3_9FIRM|nr:SDR family NAD(P)-dependent oxidoreductase [Lachnotalea glycerini]PXV95875.1 polyketide synthase PksN [Lachnotalea glycerini]
MLEVENYIYNQVSQKNLSKESAKKMLLELKNSNKKKKYKDMAIIGLACRLPGANNPEEFWDNIKNGRNCLDNFPLDRTKEWIDIYSNDVLYKFLTGVEKGEPEEYVINNRPIGGFLNDISQFDSSFFGISPKEAKFMSAEQKLMLKVAWESIEDAGYGGDKIYGTNTGVFIGKDNTTLGLYKYLTEADVMHVTGSWNSILASRLSYLYNLKGPSMIVDTACSSGLVSLHMASKAISNGECDMAIVGGLQIQYMAEISDSKLSLSMVESKDGNVRTFDKSANGTVWSEGVISVIVKDLETAIRDGDNIHAVMKGSSTNNDGASNGITAPDARAQEEVISKAWEDGEINPETISYFEAHGTGTILGDPIEIKGLTNAFRRFTDKKQFCAIGSTKANIGHTVAASGLAGVIKIIYAMKNKLLPPSINFMEVNPYIDFVNSPVYLNDSLKEWKVDMGVRRACINSFGFSGTNCHLVLEEAPKRTRVNSDKTEKIFLLSAKSESSIKELCNKYIEYLEKDLDVSIDDICYTANTGRGHYNYRLAVICMDKESLKSRIEFAYNNLISGKNRNEKNVFYGYHKVVNNVGIMEENEITENQRYELTKMLRSNIKKKKDDLENIGTLYVQGADINFKDYYSDHKYRRVSLPTYAYDDKYCCAKKKTFEIEVTKEVDRNIDHPLFDRLLADSMNTVIYETEFSPSRHWILAEHIFLGVSVVPGTSYIEMAREVCSRYFDTESIELKDLVFLSPISIKENESLKVQTILEKTDEGVKFSICSKNVDGIWTIHAKGNGSKIEKENRKYELKELRDKLHLLLYQNEDGKYYKTEMRNIENMASEYFVFGKRWQNTINVYGDERYIAEVLITQELPDLYAADLDDYYLHPALIDNAINNEISVLQGAYLPFVYKSIKIYRKTGKRLYSHIIRKNPEVVNPETATFDVVLFNEDGDIISEINSYSIKKMNVTEQNTFLNKNSNKVPYFKKVWIESPIKDESKSISSEKILIFEDNKGIGKEIKSILKLQGAVTIDVKKGDRYEKVSDNEYRLGNSLNEYITLFKELKDSSITKIVHCFGCDSPNEDNRTDEKLEDGLYSLFNITKALINNKISDNIGIYVVSKYANSVDGSEKVICPENNALIGITKVISEEHAKYATKCIDLDDETDSSKVVVEIKNSFDKVVAYRGNVRYMEQLKKYSLEEISYNEIKIKENGTYVIAGGTGALGLEVSKYLANENKVNLVLLNRSKLPERKYWDDIITDNKEKSLVSKLDKIRKIEELGSNVYSYNVDISDEDQLSKVIDDIKNKFGNIDGIVGAAGVAGDGFIMNKSRYVFDSVIKPKIHGIILLDKLTEDLNVDFFINFSSVASILAGAGQSDYTAANAFLDSFNDYRNKMGKQTKVINWPAWKEIGMAADYSFNNENNIFKEIDINKGIEAFDEILKSDILKVIPADINYDVLANNKNYLSINLSDELLEKVNNIQVHKERKNNASIKEIISNITLRGRGEEYTEIERKVAEIWCKTLDIEEVNIFDNFNSIGGDSILALQISNKMEELYPGITDITDVFSYSTIASFSEYVSGKTEIHTKIEEKEQEKFEDNNIDNLLDDFEEGNISLNDILDKFES